jgi:hypothetical protein
MKPGWLAVRTRRGLATQLPGGRAVRTRRGSVWPRPGGPAELAVRTLCGAAESAPDVTALAGRGGAR